MMPLALVPLIRKWYYIKLLEIIYTLPLQHEEFDLLQSFKHLFNMSFQNIFTSVIATIDLLVLLISHKIWNGFIYINESISITDHQQPVSNISHFSVKIHLLIATLFGLLILWCSASEERGDLSNIISKVVWHYIRIQLFLH